MIFIPFLPSNHHLDDLRSPLQFPIQPCCPFSGGGGWNKNLDFLDCVRLQNFWFQGGVSRKKSGFLEKENQTRKVQNILVSRGGVQKKNSGFSGQKSRNPEFWISQGGGGSRKKFLDFWKKKIQKSRILDFQNFGFTAEWL